MQKIIKQVIKKYAKFILILAIFIVINMYVITLPAKIIGNIVDQMVHMETNQKEIIVQIFYLLGVAITYLLTRIPWRGLATYLSRSFEKEVKEKIFSQFIKLKMADIQNIKNGEFMSYFTKDISEIRSFFFRCISHGIRIIVIFVINIYIMITNINMKLTCMTLCPILVTTFVVIKLKAYVEKSFKKSQQYFTELSEYVQESTDSIRTIKAYAGEYHQLKGFMHKNNLLKKSNHTVDIYSTLLSTSINLGFGICYAIALLVGSKLVLNGEISIGDFTAFNGYIGLFYGPVSWIPSLISRYKRAQISFQRIDSIFQLEREKINLKKIEEEGEALTGDIVITNLTYNYPTNIEVALKNINLTIPQGKILGIIGTIGSGKTTLMNLLMKLYVIQNGNISIGGKDINEIPTEVIRNNICYITQEHFLFSTTIKENITLLKDYVEKDILDSTRKSMLKDEIQGMKKGINTIIGERGVDLSGGQKQRVTLSRAFLRKSNIVILDDAFSALDNKTEEKVLENVKELTKDKTCIIISNRISDIKEADEIIVLEDGEIIQRGVHETLSTIPGLYRKFYEQQSSKEEISM